MSESLRDQLLKSGLVRTNESGPRRDRTPPPGTPRKTAERPPRREPSEIDLAKAYALRDRTEREQREREQRMAEQRAREKKERKQKLSTLLRDAALNDAQAEVPRHFPHMNRIRRIYVTQEQFPRLNSGELAVVQFAGRYLLVTRETGVAAQAIHTEALVLLCDPQAVDEDGVPADLTW
jgi:uncharacterized protein YaiL (DUF2058 family)